MDYQIQNVDNSLSLKKTPWHMYVHVYAPAYSATTVHFVCIQYAQTYVCTYVRMLKN